MLWLLAGIYIFLVTLLVFRLYPLEGYTFKENLLISSLLMLMPVPGIFFYMNLGRGNKESDASSSTEDNANRLDDLVAESDMLSATRQQLSDKPAYQDLLLSTKNMNDELAVDILKQGMRSNTENTRLISHAFYSNREHQHFREIESLIAQLRDNQFNNPRLHIALAETYHHMLKTGIFSKAAAQEVWGKISLHAKVLLKHKQHHYWAQSLLSQAEEQKRRQAINTPPQLSFRQST
uniref:Uncharacterized protein n=1 Tax=uncultured Thiotrichaceae bacterium TaxID=298394 RepID=A0A6S6SAY4_9GAMM|nr:MAG: Unknown protein [uncultured Thiotrichaceae bacterium]